MIQQTSLDAYQELMLSPHLSDLQKQVYAVLYEKGALNNRLIAMWLNKPINCITPRVMELRKMGLIGQAFRKKDYVTGKVSIFWRIKEYGKI